MKRAFCGLPGMALRRKAKGKSALAAKMPVGPTAPLTNMLVLETLLKNYYDGSMEKLNEAKKRVSRFQQCGTFAAALYGGRVDKRQFGLAAMIKNSRGLFFSATRFGCRDSGEKRGH